MAYSATIEMVQGDDLPAISYTIKDRNTPVSGQELDARDSDTWRPLTLTGKTINVDVRERGSDEVLETISAAIVDAANGKVIINILDALFRNSEGDYEFETVVTDDADLQQTVYDMFLVKVRARVRVA